MKSLIALLSITLLISCTSSHLIHFANNYEEIARTNDEIPTLSARILKLREFGECINVQCQKEILYIAISEFGEYPRQNLYKTEAAEEWTFVRWNHIPAIGESDTSISFTLKRRNNMISTIYLVKADLNSISFEAE